MAKYNLNHTFQTLLAFNAQTAEAPENFSILDSLAPAKVRFNNEFDVQGVIFRSDQLIAPARLIRPLSISDRILPEPVEPNADLAVETTRYSVTKLFDIRPEVKGEAYGTIVEQDNAQSEFIATSYSDAAEYSISIQGSITGNDGKTFSLVLETDGAAQLGKYNENSFENDKQDACIFRLQTTDNQSPNIEEASFDSLHSIIVSSDNKLLLVKISGEGKINNQAFPIKIEIKIDSESLVVRIDKDATEESVFVGSAPRERVNIRVSGGLIHQRDGKIIILNRSSGEEIRQIPMTGRLAGLAWDGSHLWQAVFPQGKLLKVDPREGGGIVGELELPDNKLVNGVTFDGHEMIAGACSANIMAGAGNTFLFTVDSNNGNVGERIPRPHAASSGFTSSPRGIFAVVSGVDQTPVSSDSAIVRLNKDTGHIEETIVLPKHFFIQDIHSENEDSFLLAVAEGLPGPMQNSAIYQLKLL